MITDEQIKELRLQGLSLRAIAAIDGRSFQRIDQRLKRKLYPAQVRYNKKRTEYFRKYYLKKVRRK